MAKRRNVNGIIKKIKKVLPVLLVVVAIVLVVLWMTGKIGGKKEGYDDNDDDEVGFLDGLEKIKFSKEQNTLVENYRKNPKNILLGLGLYFRDKDNADKCKKSKSKIVKFIANAVKKSKNEKQLDDNLSTIFLQFHCMNVLDYIPTQLNDKLADGCGEKINKILKKLSNYQAVFNKKLDEELKDPSSKLDMESIKLNVTYNDKVHKIIIEQLKKLYNVYHNNECLRKLFNDNILFLILKEFILIDENVSYLEYTNKDIFSKPWEDFSYDEQFSYVNQIVSPLVLEKIKLEQAMMGVLSFFDFVQPGGWSDDKKDIEKRKEIFNSVLQKNARNQAITISKFKNILKLDEHQLRCLKKFNEIDDDCGEDMSDATRCLGGDINGKQCVEFAQQFLEVAGSSGGGKETEKTGNVEEDSCEVYNNNQTECEAEGCNWDSNFSECY